MANYTYKDGAVRVGGKTIVNVKNNAVREGSGSAKTLVNVKDGAVREGSGSAKTLFNVKDGAVREGSGSAKTLGKVKDFTIPGMEKETDAVIVAAWHCAVKKLV